MDEAPNMVERFLQKGDRLKPKYADFDYSKLDAT